MDQLVASLHEPFNSLSHAAGALLGTVGFIVLLGLATGALQTVSVLLYGVPLILLYSSSALYHGLPVSERARNWFGRLDRASIYLLIAGTTTPPALLVLHGWIGWTMFGLLWGFALVGLVIAAVDPFRSRWSNTLVYLCMGWISVLFLGPLIEALSPAGVFWCLFGGLLYTVGAVIYALDRPRLMPGVLGAHELWHIFVLLGSGAHFVFIAGYTL